MNDLDKKMVYEHVFSKNLDCQTVDNLFWDLMNREAIDPEILAELMNFDVEGD